MSLAPIILFVYNRPAHTKQTVESLKNNLLVKESDLFVFSDGPKNNLDEKLVKEVRKYIKGINGFRQINIFEKNENKGLANSIINGVTQVLNEFKKSIVIEDDLVSSPFFVKYMNEALNFYQNENKIFSISGYSYPIDIPVKYNNDIYLLPRASSWGWGTWLNRWEKVDWAIKDYSKFVSNIGMQKIFNEGGEDLTPMLKKQILGMIDSWAVRWSYAHFKNNAYCLYPRKSLIRNIGADKSGTHTSRTNKYDVELGKLYSEINFIKNISLDEEIKNNLMTFFRISIYRKIINKIKLKN